MGEMHPAKLLPFPGEQKAVRPKQPFGWDAQMLQIQNQLERLAPTKAAVLIVGETGTGKEVAARYIHDHARAGAPFIAVNCGSFNDNMVEAELFGHEAGAFTGALQARPGWFEAAHGGTLFLDEIGDMPLHLQVKLLRVLQERQVVRLGSRKSVEVDVRVIAATNVDLEQAVRAGRFRRDLYYRLNVAAISLPPLRRRRADIVPLAQHFVDLYDRQHGRRGLVLSPLTQQHLIAHAWPGNIRELENCIHYAVIMSDGTEIGPEALRLQAVAELPEAESTSDRSHSDIALKQDLQRLLHSDQQSLYDTVERLLLVTAFEHCGRNQVQTARRLGISRNIVRALLKRFGLIETDDVSHRSHALSSATPLLVQ